MSDKELTQAGPHSVVPLLVATMMTCVESFAQQVTHLPIPNTPEVLVGEDLAWAKGALQEEVDEFVEASEKGDVQEAADGLIDLIYFALGRLVQMGVPATAVFAEVQKANMAKQQGELSKRPGSKGFDAIKPEGWVAPTHERLLTFCLQDMRDLDDLRALQAQRENISPVWLELQQLREAKGKDYNDVPGGRDAYFPFGHQSYAHMIHIKNLRLQSLLSALASGRQVNFEGLYDTVRDLTNYATFYAEALRDGRLQS